MRTFHYEDFLPNGEYSGHYPFGWERNSAVIDGHRLNQPRQGGPPNENSKRPYYPGGEILDLQIDEDFQSNYLLPRNNSDPMDTNPTVDTILENLESLSMVQFMAHGGSMINAKSIWLEGGYDPDNPDKGETKLTISSRDILDHDLPPSLYYFIACHTGHIFLEQEMDDYFPLSFIHSGSVAFIGPVTCQAICFWYKAPYGPASTQAQYFWEYMLRDNMIPSKALAKAKWTAYQEWKKNHPDDQRIEPDGPAFHLFGDPALQLYKPKIKYEPPRSNEFDIKISSPSTDPGEKFNVQIIVMDPSTSKQIDDAQFKISFNGNTQTSNPATFTSPEEPGEFLISVRITPTNADNQPPIHAQTWHQIGDLSDNDSDDSKEQPLFEIGFGLIIILVIIIMAVILISKMRKG
jgi:hypothetical protein